MILDQLKQVHDSGYVYNDLKSDNLLLNFNCKDLDLINLIDFGFATKFEDKDGQHLP